MIPAISDNRLVDLATRAHLRFMRHIPVNVHFTPPPFDHAKVVTMDGEWCLIGSSNWDTRSFRLNFEFDLECYGPELAAALDGLIDEKISSADSRRPADLSAPVWILLRDAAARLLLPYL
jgi:cardiolipin synthase